LFGETGAVICPGGNKAHELTHWTKYPTRLDCDFGGKRFGDTGYAREELVGELCRAGRRVPVRGSRHYPKRREDHASYLAHWLGRSFARTSARSSPLPRTRSALWISSTVRNPRDKGAIQPAAESATSALGQR
jgi:hypothetical protein